MTTNGERDVVATEAQMRGQFAPTAKRTTHVKGCEIQFDSPCTCEEIMAQEQIDRIVSRFLNWQLPKDFAPDCGIKYENKGFYPSGTNLFTAAQAKNMVRHILADEIKAAHQSATEKYKPLVEALRKATTLIEHRGYREARILMQQALVTIEQGAE